MPIREILANLLSRALPISADSPNTESLTIRGSHSVETYLFRDKVIEELPDIITDRFPEGIDIICYACSNGHEPYSLAMKLSDKVGKETAKNTYPIQALDMCEDVINICNQGKIVLPTKIEDTIRRKTSFPFSEAFFEGVPLQNSPLGQRISPANHTAKLGFKLHDVKDPLREMVTFDTGNVLEDVKSFSFDEPVIFMFRNVWFNFNTSQARYLAHQLGKNLPKGSLAVLGDRDQSPKLSLGDTGITTIPKILEEKGFQRLAPLGSDNIGKFVFEKL